MKRHRVGKDRHLLRHIFHRFDQVLVVVFRFPQPLAVEKRLRQGVQLVGVARRQMDADAQLLRVMEINLRVRDGGLAAPQLRRRLVAQGGQHGLDVFAGAERVGAEVGAIAMVVAHVEAANRHAVLAVRWSDW